MAQNRIDSKAEFVEFWSDHESIFLYHPNLVKQIFLGIIDLRGNHRTALRYINTEILSCSRGAETLSECRLDQLKLQRKAHKISRYISVPVNISGITGRRLKKDKHKYLMTIRWQPIMIKPPVIPVEDFYHYLGAAEESKYYRSKPRIYEIQINPQFEDTVTVITSKARARNLINLYRQPPADLKDTFIFRADSSSMRPNGITANFDLYMKAVKVKINHQIYRTTRELTQ